MKTQVNEKRRERSSLLSKGRFLLVLILIFSWGGFLKAAIVNPENETIEVSKIKKDPEKVLKNNESQNNSAKIYVTGGAQIYISGDVITSQVIIINKQKPTSHKKVKTRKNKVTDKGNTKKIIQKQVIKPELYINQNQKDQSYDFETRPDKAGFVSTNQIVLNKQNLLFLYNIFMEPIFYWFFQ